MSKEDQLRHVLECGIVAVVRSPDSQQLVEVVRALADGGVTVAEITMTVPGGLDVVKQARAVSASAANSSIQLLWRRATSRASASWLSNTSPSSRKRGRNERHDARPGAGLRQARH